MKTPPLPADFIHPRVCKPICAKLLTLPEGRRTDDSPPLIFTKVSLCYEKVLKSIDFRTFGGDKRDRTADLLNAIQALSQYKRVANPLKGVGRVLLVRKKSNLIRRF